jgi:hypothetical protein
MLCGIDGGTREASAILVKRRLNAMDPLGRYWQSFESKLRAAVLD